MVKVNRIVSAALCLVLGFAQFGVALEEKDQPIVIKAARMINVESGEVIENPVILTNGGVIVSIGKAVPDDATIIDLGDKTLLPGLIDTHVHLTMQLSPNSFMERLQSTEADFALMGSLYAKRTLMAGFTTVRNVGSAAFVDVSLKKAINRGIIIGPRIIPAAHAIGITGGHGDAGGLAYSLLEQADWRAGVADGPGEALKATRYQIKHGAEVIKIMPTAGVLSFEEKVGAQQMSFEEIRAVVVEAARHDIKVCAHAHGSEGILAAVKAGVHSIEHCSMLTDEIIAEMKDRGTYMVPTVYLTTVLDPKMLPGVLRTKAEYMLPKMKDNLRKAVERGLKIAFGTDAGVFPHGDNAGEFAMYVEAGMSELEALKTATVYAADLLGKSDRGAITEGKLADIIAVDGNPLEDINVMKKVSFVMKGGKVFKK